MFSQTFVTTVNDLSLPDRGEEAPQSPEMDLRTTFVIQPPTTQIFETDLDLSSHPIGALRIGEMPLLGEAVRHTAEELRLQLHEFVNANMRRPSGYGLLAKTFDAPVVTPIVTAFRDAAQRMERVFSDRSQDDMMSIQIRSFAHQVQSGLEEFTLSLLRSDPNETISERDLGGVLHQCIEFKGFLATIMQQIDAMNVEYRAAIRAQIEGMQQSSGLRRR